MAELLNEYIDIKNITHHVDHITLPINDSSERDRIMDELLYALTKTSRLKAA